MKKINIKNLNLKQLKILSIIGIFLISFLFHFMYTWFPNLLFSFIFPVNESIWEHMKIIVSSTLVYGIIDYSLLNKYNIKYNNFAFQLYFTMLIQIPIFLSIYLPLYKLVGENIFISIIILLITYIIGQFISYNILKERKIKVLNIIGVPIIITIYIIFIYLTYNPPSNYIFFDFKNEKYGIDIFPYISKR